MFLKFKSQKHHSKVGTAKTTLWLKSGRPGLRGAATARWPQSRLLSPPPSPLGSAPVMAKTSPQLHAPRRRPRRRRLTLSRELGFSKISSHAWTMEDQTGHRCASRPLCEGLGCASSGRDTAGRGARQSGAPDCIAGAEHRRTGPAGWFRRGETRDAWDIPRLRPLCERRPRRASVLPLLLLLKPRDLSESRDAALISRPVCSSVSPRGASPRLPRSARPQPTRVDPHICPSLSVYRCACTRMYYARVYM